MLMQCSNPGAVSDEELLASLDNGTMSPQVQKHLAHCQRCTALIRQYGQMERQLFQTLYRWNCPPGLTLGEYEQGLLSPEQARSIADHIQSCERCTEEMAMLTTFMATEPQPQFVPARQPLIYNVQQQLNTKAKQAAEAVGSYLESGIESGRRIIKAVLAPSNPGLVLQRSTQPLDTLDTWPRSYTAQDLTISLHLEQDLKYRQEVQLIGLVMRDGDVHALEGVSVQLLQQTPDSADQQVKVADAQTIDELGNFIFSSLVPALYTLEIHDGDTIVLIEGLAVEKQV
jgi:hypothetical protein